MQMAILSSEGQVTIPSDIIRKLGIEIGDKIFFVEIDGKFMIQNTEPDPLDIIQTQLKGEAQKVGWNNIDDAMIDIKEIRREIKEEKKKANAYYG